MRHGPVDAVQRRMDCCKGHIRSRWRRRRWHFSQKHTRKNKTKAICLLDIQSVGAQLQVRTHPLQADALTHVSQSSYKSNKQKRKQLFVVFGA